MQAYNTQTAVDSDHQVVMATHVTNLAPDAPRPRTPPAGWLPRSRASLAAEGAANEHDEPMAPKAVESDTLCASASQMYRRPRGTKARIIALTP